MKRGATKEEIIRATRELIARNGIRAVRVDEIAQTLGISKRTLYEMFADKNDLVGACLDEMSHQQRERIVACSKRRGGNSLQKALKLTNEYMDNLYMVGLPVSVGPPPQGRLCRTLRRTTGILAPGDHTLSRSLPRRRVAASGDRRSGVR